MSESHCTGCKISLQFSVHMFAFTFATEDPTSERRRTSPDTDPTGSSDWTCRAGPAGRRCSAPTPDALAEHRPLCSCRLFLITNRTNGFDTFKSIWIYTPCPALSHSFSFPKRHIMTIFQDHNVKIHRDQTVKLEESVQTLNSVKVFGMFWRRLHTVLTSCFSIQDRDQKLMHVFMEINVVLFLCKRWICIIMIQS